MTLTKLLWGAGLAAVAAGGLGVGALAVGQTPTSTQKTLPPPRKAEPLPPPVDAPQKPSLPPVDELRAPQAEPEPSLPATIPAPEGRTRIPPADRPGRSFTVTGPAGIYVREFADGERFALRFADDRLFIEASFGEKGQQVVAVDADYALNKEGVVFGVITGAEYEGPAADRGLGAMIPMLVGEPFAFRVRADDGSVSVKDLRLVGLTFPAHHKGVAEPGLAEWLNAVAGRYTATKELPPTARKGGKPKLPRLARPEPVEVLRSQELPPVPVPSVEPVRTVPPSPPPAGTPSLPPSPKTT